MKNVFFTFFYFILKALFVLKIFKFLLTFWACRKNKLIRKSRSISKFMNKFTKHILLNISRIKGNQTLKFDQLIEHAKTYFSLKIMQKMRKGN